MSHLKSKLKSGNGLTSIIADKTSSPNHNFLDEFSVH